MGWLSKLAGLTDHLKLDVLMDFNVLSGEGAAALRWTLIHPHASLSDLQSRIALAGLLYGRTLVNHGETRSDLFQRVGRAASRVLEGNDLAFEAWPLRVAGRDFSLWPWTITNAERLNKPKTYTATLQSTPSRLGINLQMAWGQERVLAPSCPLIAITGLAGALEKPERARLARVLLAMNAYYRSAKIGIGSEIPAIAAAIPVLLAQANDVEIPQTNEIEVLSKSDALRLFAMSRREWEGTIAAAVAAESGQRTPPSPDSIGVQVKTPDGFVITRLNYSKGDTKPLFIQVVSGYAPGQRQPVFTEALGREMIANVQRQMAPEFDVIGSMERAHGGLAFIFMITDLRSVT